MSCQVKSVKTSGQCQLRDKKIPIFFNCFIFNGLSLCSLFNEWAFKTLVWLMPKKGQFTQERVEYNVFLFDGTLKGSKSLKSLKLAWRFILTSCDIYQIRSHRRKFSNSDSVQKIFYCKLFQYMYLLHSRKQRPVLKAISI
jgi:hypothetical protein